MNKITKEEAINVINAWSSIEVLSPQVFLKPENLAGGDPKMIAELNKKLPWQDGGEKNKPKTKLFYQIIVGTIDFDKATLALLEKYNNTNNTIEKAAAKGEGVIGVIMVDQQGYPLSVALSSFAWGIHKALQGDLKNLATWPTAEKDIAKKFEEGLLKKDEDDNYLPITKSTLNEAYNYLVRNFKIPDTLHTKKQFAIKIYEPVQKEESIPPTLLLNSFYLEDLKQAKWAIEEGRAPANLKKYLSMIIPAERHDILNENNTKPLEDSLAPRNMSPSRWPRPGRHPLILLQQAAVNLIRSELKHEGILAINGPPGTGKTTLLQDVLASVITDKAEALLKFDDPSMAFTRTVHKISAGKGWLYVYKIDESLKGFEILISSSNNKAVENLSAELPNLSSIADDAHELRYFSVIAEALIGNKAWGLISAVLGNNGNRHRFRQKFWWDEDCGLATYLAEACGIPQKINIKDLKTGQIIGTRKPRIILENDPPHNQNEALRRWKQARESFIQTLNNCRSKLNELENLRQDIQELENFIIKEGIKLGNNTLEELLIQNQLDKPGIFQRIIRSEAAVKWKKELNNLSYCYIMEEKIKPLSKKIEKHIINAKFLSKDHADKDRHTTSPWCDEAVQILRDQVFIESIKLTKAFIDAAAKPLLHNIGILMKIFCKQVNQAKEQDDEDPDINVLQLLPDLWSSFFLVVPSISTTFASVNRMLGYLPQNYLGWLIIDEAGQAVPQAAIGAITKTKRAVVTGDPMQIEPIVVLPEMLTNNICKNFNVDIDLFNAPQASVQTLADALTPYYKELQSTDGVRTIGMPLLVHRRCSEPMFSISNEIAYSDLMVQAKTPKSSLIRKCLGSSGWFDVSGQAKDKWCPEEGEMVIEILQKLKNNMIFPDLYIVTPFKIVAQNLRMLIIENGIMDSWPDITPYLWINERIGTVHTVQGREADSVILVLGAQAKNQSGARYWAGSKPNILNVAVTRAKENVYVVGNKELWKDTGVFSSLSRINDKDINKIK
jgi:flagellar biosynthesis GTPase FlhF